MPRLNFSLYGNPKDGWVLAVTRFCTSDVIEGYEYDSVTTFAEEGYGRGGKEFGTLEEATAEIDRLLNLTNSPIVKD
jgi:hypothetical protein